MEKCKFPVVFINLPFFPAHLTVTCLKAHPVTRPPIPVVLANLPHGYLSYRCLRWRFLPKTVRHRPIIGVRSPRTSLRRSEWAFRCGCLAGNQWTRSIVQGHRHTEAHFEYRKHLYNLTGPKGVHNLHRFLAAQFSTGEGTCRPGGSSRGI